MRTAYRRVGAAGVAVVLVGAAAATARAEDDDAGRYRLAEATIGDVEETLALSGTLAQSARSDVAFGTDGTVAKVYVEQGQRVRKGQKIASLDTSSLEAAVVAAKAALAEARARLAADLEAQSSAVEDSASPKPTPPSQPQQPTEPEPEQPNPEQPNPELEQALQQLAEQQQAVVAAQSEATAAIATAKDALAAQQAACMTPESQECADALVAVQAAQDVVALAQDALQAAIAELATTLTAAIEAVSADTAEEYTDVPAIAMESTGDTAATSPTPTAGTIASDQAAIDEAKAALLSTRRNLESAVLRAPRDGRVAALDLVPGQSVSAGTTVGTILGKGRVTLVASTTTDQVDRIEVGQAATVAVPGRSRPLDAEVTSVGLLPTTGDAGTTYTVTLTLDGGAALPTGASASAAVVIGTADDVVTVPASAVSDGAVRVLTAGAVERRQVTVGTVGRTRIEVAGIEAGTTVVLADGDEPLPDGNQTGGFGGPGGDVNFGGGGGQGFARLVPPGG